MSKHTPGPWEVDYDHDGSPSAIVPSDGRESLPCDCPDCSKAGWGGRTYSELVTCDSHVYGPTRQDAVLIASAPELLEALKGLLADIEDYQRINHLGGEQNQSQVVARAVIQKAEGKV